MNEYSKAIETRQYSEIVYYRDGEEIARETMNDDQSYDLGPHEPMTAQEILDWS